MWWNFMILGSLTFHYDSCWIYENFGSHENLISPMPKKVVFVVIPQFSIDLFFFKEERDKFDTALTNDQNCQRFLICELWYIIIFFIHEQIIKKSTFNQEAIYYPFNYFHEMKGLLDRVKNQHHAVKKQHQQSSSLKKQDHHHYDQTGDTQLNRLKYWMGDVEPIKIMKLSEQMMTKVLQNWSKFRLNILKYLNEQESKMIDLMARLRKQVQWLNQIKAGQVPELTKITAKLYKDCQQFMQREIDFNFKSMFKQSKLISDKILDSTRSIYDDIKQSVSELYDEVKDLCSIRQILQEKTYFQFLKDQKHSEIVLYDKDRVSCRNQSYDMDFGVVAGPMLTKNNNKIGFKIQTNDKYQCFIGLGICHIHEVKAQIYKGVGPKSGSYVIRQENDHTQAIALNHKNAKYGSQLKQKFIGWGFGEGDIILVEVDFDRNYVCFSKQDDYFEMPFDGNSGPIGAYVTLHSKWDCVSIMNS